MLFPTDDDALKYFKDRVPPEAEAKEVDLEPLKERLFDIPEDLSPGEYEFEGKNGYKVSFKLVKSAQFDICYLDLKGDTDIEGDWRPIYAVVDLMIETPNSSYSLKYPASANHERIHGVYWLPGLSSGEGELSHKYVNIGERRIYLLAEDGFLSRPLDLLGFFHEVGHIETNSDLPHNQDTTTHFMGFSKPWTVKMSAYELQREEHANRWMMENRCTLFEDLGIPAQLVEDYCNHVQLKSYHDSIRWRFLEALDGLPEGD